MGVTIKTRTTPSELNLNNLANHKALQEKMEKLDLAKEKGAEFVKETVSRSYLTIFAISLSGFILGWIAYRLMVNFKKNTEMKS